MSGDISGNKTIGGSMTASRVTTTLGLLPVIALSATLTGPAHAQDEGAVTELDEISVVGTGESDPRTSLRVEEGASRALTAPLIDTPRTVQIITERQIEERGASSLYDVLRTTPGVTLGTGEGGNPMGDRPFIRGYEASTDIFVDGFRSLGRSTYEAFNLESIEIIKGPGGAYAGRGATGGSLNLVTKQARIGETFHDLSGTIGTDNQYRGSYDGNLQLGPEAAARLNLFWQDAEVPGRGGIEDDKLGIAGSITGNITDRTRATLNFYRNRSESTPDLGIPMANAIYLANFGDRFGSGTPDDPFLPIGNVNHDRFFGSFLRDFREVNQEAVTLKVEHEFTPNLRIESAFGYVGTDQHYIVTRPTFVAPGVLDRASRQGFRDDDNVAWVTNLSGEVFTGPIEHSYVIGFEMGRERLHSRPVGNVPAVPREPNFLEPDPWAPITGGPSTLGDLSLPTTTRSASLYAFDTIRFNEQWMANLGARIERFDVTQPTASGELNRVDDIFTYQLGLVYKPVPYGSIYASYGTSANPTGQCASLAGGSEGAGACTLGAGNVDLGPERNRSYEIGTKWDLFDERLSLTAALFRTDKTNARSTDQFGNIDLIGSSRAQGFELGVAGNITDQWSIFGGYTFIDAKLTDGGFTNGQPNPNTGNHLHYIARHNFSVWTTYDVTEKWTVGGGATYMGKRFMNAANTAALPAHWRVDLMTSYDFNENASLQVNVNNVFNEKLYDASHVGLFANTGPGRNATLTLRYRF